MNRKLSGRPCENFSKKQPASKVRSLSGKETEAEKFKDYFDYAEKISTIPSHRILAVLRGFMEGFLRMEITPAEEEALALMENQFIKSSGESAIEIKKAIKDCWRRLLQPGMESEFRMALKDQGR